jgi:hypothetical protein
MSKVQHRKKSSEESEKIIKKAKSELEKIAKNKDELDEYEKKVQNKIEEALKSNDLKKIKKYQSDLEKIKKFKDEIHEYQNKKLNEIQEEYQEDAKEIIINEELVKNKYYGNLVTKTKSKKSRTLLNFLAMFCASVLEAVNLDAVFYKKIGEQEQGGEGGQEQGGQGKGGQGEGKGGQPQGGQEQGGQEQGGQGKGGQGEGKGGQPQGGQPQGGQPQGGQPQGQEQGQGQGGEMISIESFKLDKEYYLIQGDVQSGKTKFLQGIALAHIVWSRCAVVVILRNCSNDEQQLHNRFSKFIQTYFKDLKMTGVNSLKYFYVGGSSEDKLRDAVNNCSMIVAIANKTQIDKLKNVLKDDVKYATVIDEADAVAYGDDKTDFRKTLHECVLENSGRTYLITATTFDVMFKEKKIPSKNIIRLPVNPEYRGLRKIQMKIIDPKNDNELHHYLTLLSERDAYEHHGSDILHNRSKKTDHPLIMLIKKFHLKIKQQALAREISDIGNWTEVIVFNGEGLTIYTKSVSDLVDIIRSGIKGENFTIKPKIVNICEKERKECLVVKAQISEGLQYFRELHKKRRITHIAIVSDGMADRGLSFVSEDFKWHLTSQYYEPNKSVCSSNLIQSIRLCGNYKDDLPSVLYSTEKVCNDLTKSFLIHDEVLDRCKGSDLGQSIPSTVERIPLCFEKVPKRKFGVKEAKLNIVVGDDGGVSMKIYNRALAKIDRIKIEEVDEKEEMTTKSKGKIYTVDIEALQGALLKAASDTVDKITENNKWVDRKVIIDKLVFSKVYKLSTIRAYLTRIQQSVAGTNTISRGLNFREKSNKEIEMLYKPF